MKPIRTAVVLAALIAGFTACEDTAKKNLAMEMENALPEFLSVDSTLNSIQAEVSRQKDSLNKIAVNNPQQKVEIDSILNSYKRDIDQIDSFTLVHGEQTLKLDSLKDKVSEGEISVEDGNEQWNRLMKNHLEAKTFADNTSLILVIPRIEKQNPADTGDKKEKKK
jgi:hypothetical protein